VSEFTVERDDASAPFFDAAANGTLLVRHCPACGATYQPQQPRCADGTELEWVPASGRGTLVAWAVDHSPALDPALASSDGWSVFGLVELDEGPWLQVPIVDVDPATLVAGRTMHVRFVRPGTGEAIPAFSPA
jgi:uncharacterized protein